MTIDKLNKNGLNTLWDRIVKSFTTKKEFNSLSEKVVEDTRTTTDSILTNSKAASLKINSIKGKSEQKRYTGKNLLQNTAVSQTIDNVSFTINSDGSVSVTGTPTEDTFLTITNGIVLPAGTYIFSQGISIDPYTTLQVIDKSSGSVDVICAINDVDNRTFTLTEEMTVDVRIRIGAGYNANGLKFYPMIHLASIEDDTYEPYVGGIASPNGKYPQGIKSVGGNGWLTVTGHGKNHFNNTLVGTSKQGIVITVNNDKSIHMSGTPTITSGTVVFYVTNKNNLEANVEYIFSAGNKTYGYWHLYLSKMDTYSTEKSIDKAGISHTTGETNKSFNITEEEKKEYPYIIIEMGVVYTTSNADRTFYPMIYRADEENTTYEAYTEKSITIPLSEPLRGVDDVKDIIFKQDGVWGIGRWIDKYIISGTENLVKNSNDVTDYIYYFFKASYGIYTNSSNCLCTHLIKKSYAAFDGICTYQINYPNTLYLGLKNVGLSDNTVDAAKAWLTENKPTIIYIRSNPVFEPFADIYQQLFYELESYDNITYTFTDEEVNPEIEVEYATTESGANMLNNYANIGKSALKDIVNNENALNQQTIGYTKKNLYNNAYNLITCNISGIQITSNDDGTFNVIGKPTSNFNGLQKSFVLKKGLYRASRKNATYTGVGYTVYSQTRQKFLAYEMSNNIFEVTEDEEILDVRIQVSANLSSVNDTNQAIMIRSADILDSTYEPYVETVDERLNGVIDKSDISQSTAITEKGEYTVDAVELNASIQGTLAYKLNDALKRIEALENK